jgi:hypothetical protein
LNSTPQLFGRDRGAVAQGAQLGPGDLRMDAAAEAAVGAGDNVFAADDVSELGDAIGNQFRVLDEIGGVADQVGLTFLLLIAKKAVFHSLRPAWQLLAKLGVYNSGYVE